MIPIKDSPPWWNCPAKIFITLYLFNPFLSVERKMFWLSKHKSLSVWRRRDNSLPCNASSGWNRCGLLIKNAAGLNVLPASPCSELYCLLGGLREALGHRKTIKGSNLGWWIFSVFTGQSLTLKHISRVFRIFQRLRNLKQTAFFTIFWC